MARPSIRETGFPIAFALLLGIRDLYDHFEGLGLRGCCGGLLKRADDCPPGQLDLEAVVPKSDRTVQNRVCNLAENFSVG